MGDDDALWAAEQRSRRRHNAFLAFMVFVLPFLLVALSIYAADIAQALGTALRAYVEWALDGTLVEPS